MPQIFPLTNYGNRMIEVTILTGQTFHIRTYYSEGQINAWFFDMWDSQMEPVIKGIPMVVGSANLIAAYADKFPEGMKIIVVLTDGKESDPDNLGNGLDLVIFSPGEESPFTIPDPMLSAQITDFEIVDPTNGDHNTLTNRFIPNQHDIGAIQGLSDALLDKATKNDLLLKMDKDDPHDGRVYGRRNGQWVVADTGGGGGGGGTDSTFFYLDGTSLRIRSSVIA